MKPTPLKCTSKCLFYTFIPVGIQFNSAKLELGICSVNQRQSQISRYGYKWSKISSYGWFWNVWRADDMINVVICTTIKWSNISLYSSIHVCFIWKRKLGNTGLYDKFSSIQLTWSIHLTNIRSMKCLIRIVNYWILVLLVK